MRDDDASRPLPLAVMVQPDPMLEEHPAGSFRIVATMLGAAAIVTLALYGMTRPPEPQQMAAAPAEAQTAPAGGGAANSAGGQAKPANGPAQNPQTNAQQPTTTGQSSGDQGSAAPSKAGQGVGQAGQPKTPPASGGSATSAVGPGAKPAPEAR